jgi:hypothetical protein
MCKSDAFSGQTRAFNILQHQNLHVSLQVLAFSSAVMLGFYAIISSVFSSRRISRIHSAFYSSALLDLS